MTDPTASQPQPEPAAQPAPAAPPHASIDPTAVLPAAAQQPPFAQPTSTVAAGPRPPRRVLGIQPVLFVGIVLLTLVTLLTIILIFVGDIETQAPRVAWTVVAFIGFTALLALDLALSRRSALPLVIGVVANVYLLAVLMLATWVEPVVVTPPDVECDPYDGCDYADSYDPYGPPLAIVLFGVYLLAFLVVRAAAAGAWALVVLGRRGVVAFARVVGLVAASLLGLAGVMLTLHLAIEPFGIRVGDTYWRIAVAIVVLAALGACITTLLYWNRRQLDRPEPEPAPAVPPGAAGAPVAPAQQMPQPQPWPPHPYGAVPPGWGAPGWPPQAPGQVPGQVPNPAAAPPAGSPQQGHPPQQPWGPPPQ